MRQGAWVISVAIAALAGCSLTLDLSECETDDDCTESLICTGEGFCATEHSAYSGPQYQSPECSAVYGPVYSKDALLLGTLLPLTGLAGDSARQMEQAVIMAVDAFNANGGLLPGGRSLALVLCDTAGSPEKGVKALHHLQGLGVPAIIGPATDAVAQAVAEAVAISNQTGEQSAMLVMSPSATALSLSTAEDSGADLIWRTVAPAQVRLAAIRTMLDEPGAHGLPSPITGVSVLYNAASTHASDLKAALQISLDDEPLPGLDAESIEWVDYAPDVTNVEWVHQPSRDLFLHAPDVTIVLGGTEVPQLVAWLEALWFSAPYGCDRAEDGWNEDGDDFVDADQVLAFLRCSRLKSLGSPPHWILDQGDMREKIQEEITNYSLYCVEKSPDRGGECLEQAETFDIEEALSRISGMTQGEGDGAALQTFRDRFQSVHGTPVLPATFAAHAWDATHLLGFGLAGALLQPGETAPDASAIAKGIRLLQSGAGFALADDPALVSAALATLQIDGKIDLAGASGALDFNSAGEPGTGAVHRWRPLITPGSFLLSSILDGEGNVLGP